MFKHLVKAALVAAAAALLAGCGGGSGRHRGDVVSFEPTQAAVDRCGMAPGSVHEARIVGLPGDTVRTTLGGSVLVDGEPLDEPYATSSSTAGAPAGTWKVPARAYFLMSDDRGRSCDSRVYGPVPAANLRR
jgi:signal peptidase I